MSTWKEIKQLDDKGLIKKLHELRKQIFELRIQSSTTGLEKSHFKKSLKRDVARVLTVINKPNAKRK